MHLKVLLPFRVFIDQVNVSRIVAETREGSFGLLPRRRDCVAALVPGILIYETEAGGEVFVAVDDGVLIKAGDKVNVLVRRAALDEDLARLHETVLQEYQTLDTLERGARAATQKLESSFVGRFARFHAE